MQFSFVLYQLLSNKPYRYFNETEKFAYIFSYFFMYDGIYVEKF